MDCLKPWFNQHLPWMKVQTDEQGSQCEMIPPALAIAALVFHPKLWAGMWKAAHVQEAKGEEELGGGPDGERVYGHPFTCDEALRCQAVVDAKPEVEGETNMLLGLGMGKDKSDLEREKSADITHLKVLNTALKVLGYPTGHAYAWHGICLQPNVAYA